MAHSMKTDKISRLHYIFNHASAQRIRYLCKCNDVPGLTDAPVKAFDHIKDCCAAATPPTQFGSEKARGRSYLRLLVDFCRTLLATCLLYTSDAADE